MKAEVITELSEACSSLTCIAWFGSDVVKPEPFNSVIVWGLLEDEYQLDAHEGFWCGRNWWSVRQNETDPMAKKKLSGVTHWMPRQQAPNAESSDASDAFAATICSAVRPESLQKPNETGSK